MSVTRRPHDRLLQCTATYPLEKRSPEECQSYEMHPRALHVLAFAATAVVRAGCDDKVKWYSGLRSMLKNCPSESQNNSGQDDLLDTFRRCVQQRVVDTLDTLLDEDVITVFGGVDLVRFRPINKNITEYKYFSLSMSIYKDHLKNNILKTGSQELLFKRDNSADRSDDNTNWSTIIWSRLTRVLRTHAFKVDVDHMFNTESVTNNASESDLDSNIVQGRKRRYRRRHHFLPMMTMGLLLMGLIVIPMGFQFLAVLGGKALILAKMALILSSIQGLKKIATSGVNYGLYHAPAWHDRSHEVFPEEEEHLPLYVPSHP